MSIYEKIAVVAKHCGAIRSNPLRNGFKKDTAQNGNMVIIIGWDISRSYSIEDCFGLLRYAPQCLATTAKDLFLKERK